MGLKGSRHAGVPQASLRVIADDVANSVFLMGTVQVVCEPLKADRTHIESTLAKAQTNEHHGRRHASQSHDIHKPAESRSHEGIMVHGAADDPINHRCLYETLDVEALQASMRRMRRVRLTSWLLRATGGAVVRWMRLSRVE